MPNSLDPDTYNDLLRYFMEQRDIRSLVYPKNPQEIDELELIETILCILSVVSAPYYEDSSKIRYIGLLFKQFWDEKELRKVKNSFLSRLSRALFGD